MIFVLAAITFWSRNAHVYSRLVLLFSFVTMLVTVPYCRKQCRKHFASLPGWGLPAIIYGDSEIAQSVIQNLQLRVSLGLTPVAIIKHRETPDTSINNIPAWDRSSLQKLAGIYPCSYFIIAESGLNNEEYYGLLNTSYKYFPKTIVIPGHFGQANIWATTVDISGILGLETGQKILSPTSQFYKRIMDLTSSFIGLLILFPVFLIIGLTIKLDSPGPVLYRQRRLSKGGVEVDIWKFRTMVSNADTILEDYLSKDPTLKAKWEQDYKLDNDPRITRVGRFMRKYSIDELPQLFNVLKGEMSLVGPRPIVKAEATKYMDNYELYLRVLPGMTGLWQISGRSNLSYSKRIDLDVYYIRNWSIWFDLYILIRTPAAIFNCVGAC
ncbi:undecaprenyl-phosphate galactose phosphotransferase WbaP [Pseudodesulfovibrio methanolicus]|uniref:Undecaprenyl-phosphate galactose phosphotransferase WbaP n=1 Tax=Pseudodesulfovibrio methanolicus TaxID=3126690 RepID=A0ABZ2IXL8_9BACT